MIEMPVSGSPASSVRWIGAAPRQRGRSEAWMLIAPRRGISSTACGRIRPYAATTNASGASARSPSCTAGVFSVGGCRTGIPRRAAACLTALAAATSPRPAGRSGWVRTAGTWWPAVTSASNAGTAKSGVPANTMRIARRPRAEARRGSGGLPELLLHPRLDPGALKAREVLDEDLALEVVHLVLDADRQHALCVPLERHAIGIK